LSDLACGDAWVTRGAATAASPAPSERASFGFAMPDGRCPVVAGRLGVAARSGISRNWQQWHLVNGHRSVGGSNNAEQHSAAADLTKW